MSTPFTKNTYGKRVYQGVAPPYYDVIDIDKSDPLFNTYTYSLTLEDGTLSIQQIVRVTYETVEKTSITQVRVTYSSPTAY